LGWETRNNLIEKNLVGVSVVEIVKTKEPNGFSPWEKDWHLAIVDG
jgi:hypothetical protein